LNYSCILVGGNSGDRETSLESAVRLIEQEAGNVIRQSSIYETEPWGFLSDTPFLNQVILVQTPLSPSLLLSALNSIEKKMGRKRDNGGYTSRVIDLDILFYNDCVIRTKKLQIPHPKMQFRRFVMVPLNEIAGEYVHPVLKVTLHQLALDCPDRLSVKLFKSFAEVHAN
jgi:2-amino-4-hydroxy-6-hydroxymethyldihydropteridine diphosphokinase